MSEMPKTREWEQRWDRLLCPRNSTDTPDYLAKDMRDELLGRIAELELGHKTLDAQRKKHREAREQAEATIEAKERIIVTLVSERRANRKLLKQAEAALAAMNIEEGS